MKITEKIKIVLLLAISIMFANNLEAQDTKPATNYDQGFRLGIGANVGYAVHNRYKLSLGAKSSCSLQPFSINSFFLSPCSSFFQSLCNDKKKKNFFSKGFPFPSGLGNCATNIFTISNKILDSKRITLKRHILKEFVTKKGCICDKTENLKTKNRIRKQFNFCRKYCQNVRQKTASKSIYNNRLFHFYLFAFKTYFVTNIYHICDKILKK